MADDLIFETKPIFNPIVRFTNQKLLTVYFTALILVPWFFFFALLILDATNTVKIESNKTALIVYLTANILTLALIIGGTLLADKLNCMATTYKLYSDKLVMDEGFVNHKHTNIMLDDVKEVHFTESFLQRLFGLGTVEFVTAACTAENTEGIKFADIKDGAEVYSKCKELL